MAEQFFGADNLTREQFVNRAVSFMHPTPLHAGQINHEIWQTIPENNRLRDAIRQRINNAGVSEHLYFSRIYDAMLVKREHRTLPTNRRTRH